MDEGFPTFHAMNAWRVLRKVADGGMSAVHVAEQLGFGGFTRVVGVKRMRPELLERPQYRELFLSEARLVAELAHENIQQVHGLVEWDGVPVIITEWIDGLNLEQLNARLDDLNAYLPPNLALHIVARVASALAWAWTKSDGQGRALKLVHCDLSPVNILVGWRGVVKLVDFGIARASCRSAESLPNEILGKSPYLSPEQASGEDLDARSDIFTLGLVLFELLTGEQAFPAQNIDETKSLHGQWDVRSPREWNPAISLEVERILERMMAREPSERFASMSLVVEAIDGLLYRHGPGPDAERLAAYLRGIFPEAGQSGKDVGPPTV